MPTKKSSYRRKYKRRGKSYKAFPNYKFAKKVINLAAEKNYYELNTSGTFDRNNELNHLLTEPAQGDTAITRTGNMITPTSLRFRMSCRIDPLSNYDMDYVRVIVYQWMENHNDHPPTSGNIIQTSWSAQQNVLSVLAQTGKNEFRVLYDRTKRISRERNPDQLLFECNIPGSKLRPIRWSGANPTHGHIKVLAFTQMNNHASPNDEIDFFYHSMLRYTDA